MNDTELLKELLGHFYVTDDGNIDWLYNDGVDGLRYVGESPKVIEALVKRRSELYGDEAQNISTQQTHEEICEWKETDEMWETSCGNGYTIIDGTPTDNEMKFCTYCGRKLHQFV